MGLQLGRVVEGVGSVVVIGVCTCGLCKCVAWLLWPGMLVSFDASLQFGVNRLVLGFEFCSFVCTKVDVFQCSVEAHIVFPVLVLEAFILQGTLVRVRRLIAIA